MGRGRGSGGSIGAVTYEGSGGSIGAVTYDSVVPGNELTLFASAHISPATISAFCQRGDMRMMLGCTELLCSTDSESAVRVL